MHQEVCSHLPAGGEGEVEWPGLHQRRFQQPRRQGGRQALPVLGRVTRAPGQSTGGSRPGTELVSTRLHHSLFPPHTACPQDQRPSKCGQEPLGVPKVLPFPSAHLCEAGFMPDNTRPRSAHRSRGESPLLPTKHTLDSQHAEQGHSPPEGLLQENCHKNVLSILTCNKLSVTFQQMLLAFNR